MAQAELGKRTGVFDRLFGQKQELPPEVKWTKAFDQQMKIDPQNVLRFNKGRSTHVSLQQYGDYRMAHFDEGDSHARRMTVAMGHEGKAYLVRSIPDQFPKPTSHTWEVLDVTPSELAKHLKDTEKDISGASLHDTRNAWKGQIVENDKVLAAITASRLKQ